MKAKRASRGMYIFTLSLTLAPHVGGWSAPRPGRITSRKNTRYPLHRRLVASQGWFGQARKILTPPGFDPRTVQPVAIPAHGSLCAFGVGRAPLWAQYRISPIIMVIPLFLPFGRRLRTGWVCPLYLSYAVKPVLNVI